MSNEFKLPRPGTHIPSLDGVRGVAIALVLVLHLTERLEQIAVVSPWISKLTGVGWSGVGLFFVLSGFLITGILLDSKGGHHYFRAFYLRRILRIFPLYYAYLAVLFLLVPALFTIRNLPFGVLVEHQAWYWLYLSNILNAINGGWGPDGFATTHFWSLAIEEQFYLAWPAIVWLTSRRQLLGVCLTCVATLPFARLGLRLADVDAVAVYVLTPTRLDALALGALLAALVREPAWAANLMRFLRPLTLGCAAAVFGLFIWRGGLNQFDIVTGTIGYSVLASFYGCLIISAIVAPEGSILRRMMTHPASMFFGRYSYGIYVFHLPVVGLLALVFPTADLAAAMGSALAGVAFFAVALSTTVVVALTSWHLLEKQALKLKRFVPYGTANSQPLLPSKISSVPL